MNEPKEQKYPLPVRILAGPVLAIILLSGADLYFGSLHGRPEIVIGALAIAALGWLRVLWPAGFRRRG